MLENQSMNLGQENFSQESQGTVESTQNEATLQGGQQTQQQQEIQTDNQQIDFDSLPDDKPVLTKKQVSQIIRERVNKLSPYKKAIEQLAKAANMTEKEVVEFIMKQATAQANLSTYPQPPVNNSVINNQPVIDPQIYQLAQTAGQIALETKRQVELAELKQNPLYSDLFSDEELQEEVLARANKYGIPIKEAYWQINGERKAKAIEKEVEQRVLANIQKRAGLGAESDFSSEDLKKLDLTAEEIQFAKAIGIDPEEYSLLKKTNNLGDFEKISQSKKKK